MDITTLLSHVYHTLLAPEATWNDIRTLCDDAIEYKAATVCLPPYFVSDAVNYINERLPVCTVIGFPNGYSTSKVKCFEAQDAIESGASEVDMVVNIGLVKNKQYDKVLDEIVAVKKVCSDIILKVIVETCLLTLDEKIEMCNVVSDSGADFIKTSTGFSSGGATFEDILILKKYCAPHVKIKAAGGIASIEDAQKFLELGASRLGTSRIIKLVKQVAKI